MASIEAIQVEVVPNHHSSDSSAPTLPSAWANELVARPSPPSRQASTASAALPTPVPMQRDVATPKLRPGSIATGFASYSPSAVMKRIERSSRSANSIRSSRGSSPETHTSDSDKAEQEAREAGQTTFVDEQKKPAIRKKVRASWKFGNRQAQRWGNSLCILIYILLGMFTYRLVEHKYDHDSVLPAMCNETELVNGTEVAATMRKVRWTYIDALYFCMSTMSTVSEESSGESNGREAAARRVQEWLVPCAPPPLRLLRRIDAPGASRSMPAVDAAA